MRKLVNPSSVTIYMEKDLKTYLQKKAEDRRESLNEYLSNVLIKYVDTHENFSSGSDRVNVHDLDTIITHIILNDKIEKTISKFVMDIVKNVVWKNIN